MSLCAALTLTMMSHSAFAQERFIPQTKGLLEADVVFTGQIESTSTLRELNVSVYSIPVGAASYEIDAEYELEKDDRGNTYTTLTWEDVETASYEIRSRVVNSARIQGAKRVRFPYEPPREVLSYLAPTNKSVITPEIRAKALELTQGADNAFEAVTALSTWIHENVEYDRRYAGRYLAADQVIDQKVGVCAEFTTLMVSMARAVGIPARSVAGVIYGPDGAWGYHAWAEVYLDGWVPVDATWNEIGWLDATHIELGKFEDGSGVETRVFYTYNALQRPSVQFEPPQTDVNVKRSEPIRRIFETQAQTFPNSIGEGDAAVVEVVVENTASGCIATSTEVESSVYRGVDIVKVTDPITIAACPGEEQRSHFVLKVNDALDLDPRFKYYNLATIRTFLGEDVTADLEILPADTSRSNLDLRVERTTATVGDRIGFSVDTDAPDFRVYSDLPVFGSNIVAAKTGRHYVIAATSTGEVERKEIVVRQDLPFAVKNVEKPSRVACGQAFNVTFEVENLKDFSQEIEVETITSDDLEAVAPFEVRVEKKQTASVTISTRVAEACSGQDQFLSVGLGDQRVHETIDVEKAATPTDIASSIIDAVRRLFQSMIDSLKALIS